MKTKKLLTGLLVLSIATTCLMGCRKSKEADIPFSKLGFDVTYDEMVDVMGTPKSDRVSYLGTAYAYDNDYLGLSGNVEYTFDEEGKVSCISWIYASEDGEEITQQYNDLHTYLENKYGETNESSDKVTQLTDIWRLDSGNIQLIALITSDYNVIMYNYISPEHSTTAEEIANRQ